MAGVLAENRLQPEHSCQEILQRLNSLRQGRHHCDLEVLVGDVTLPAHKLLLIATSEVMKTLLGECEGPTSLHLAGHRQEDVALLLDFLYTGQIDLSEARVAQVRSLALELQVDTLIRVCDAFALRASTEKTEDPADRRTTEVGTQCDIEVDSPKTDRPRAESSKVATRSSPRNIGGKAPLNSRASSVQRKVKASRGKQGTGGRVDNSEICGTTESAIHPGKGAPLLRANGGLPPDRTLPKDDVIPRIKILEAPKPRFSCATCSETFFYEPYYLTHLESHSAGGDLQGGDLLSMKQESQGGDSMDVEPPLAELTSAEVSQPPVELTSTEQSQPNLSLTPANQKPTCRKPVRSKKNRLVMPNADGLFECKFCLKTFSDRTELSHHKGIHSGEKRYRCSLCDKRFYSKASQADHERTHTGIKPYKCDLCPSGFFTSGGLAYHKLRHTGVRPFLCEVCSAAFTTKACFISHSRIHTGEKPFSCDVCSRSFRTNSLRKAHVERAHTKGRSFLCPTCGHASKTKDALKRHEKIHLPGKVRRRGKARSKESLFI